MMTQEKVGDFYSLTFSQREGEAPLPEPMQLRHISRRFRQFVCLHMEKEMGNYSSESEISSLIMRYRHDILGEYIDEIGKSMSKKDVLSRLRISIKWGSYHEVLTLIEYFVRHEQCPRELREGLMSTFDAGNIAYFIEDINGMPTIVPRLIGESGEATQQAIKTLRDAHMDPAATHLRAAAEHINAGQFSDSVADSIGAVESVACRISPETKTLGDALKALEKRGLLKNAQLKAGIEKLYAYTNSEEGIRHARVLKEAPDVGLEEAMFMFGACASFAAYLAEKHRKMTGGGAGL